LQAEGRLGPIYGLPWVGSVDFTPAGARLWQDCRTRFWTGAYRRCAYTDAVHLKTTRYFRSRELALAEVEKYRDWDGVSVEGPS
jgi:hypothetical protein